MELFAKYDCIIKRNKHFTIGELGDNITGGLYIRNEHQTPEEITIVFTKKKGDKKDENAH